MRVLIPVVAASLAVAVATERNDLVAGPVEAFDATLTRVAAAVEPVEVAFRPGDDSADDGMYVAERGGTVWRVVDGEATAALDISDLVSTDGRRGILGMAFAADGHHGYVNYTDAAGDPVVTEYAIGQDGRFGRATARVVITIDQPYPNDRGGHLELGPDDLLYIGSGDGGGDADPDFVGQSLVTLLGKLLRVDPTPSGDLGYSNPPDNPYTGLAGLLDELWSLGLQDARRFSFDPDTGDLWVADVGQRGTQEITVAPAVDGSAGRNTNFGWSAYEGEVRINNEMTAEQWRRPLFTYGRERGRCAISGGVRARGAGAGPLAGWYVFADLCSGEVIALPIDGTGEDLEAGTPVTLATTTAPSGVASGPDGELYVLSADAVNRLDVG